jgi:hypothetical protein
VRTAAERNLAAEARAVEEGHRAVLDNDGSKPFIKVVSDTHEGKAYRVDAMPVGMAGEAVAFVCQPTGRKAFQDDHYVSSAEPGVTACKHAAVAARRMEREGLIELADDGYWRATTKAVPPPSPADEDPFACFDRDAEVARITRNVRAFNGSASLPKL